MTRETQVFYYQYNTHAGTVSLIPEPKGRYKVMFHEQNLGSYASPEQAADDVSGGHTFTPSDGTDLGRLNIPADLGEWEKKLFFSVQHLRPG